MKMLLRRLFRHLFEPPKADRPCQVAGCGQPTTMVVADRFGKTYDACSDCGPYMISSSGWTLMEPGSKSEVS